VAKSPRRPFRDGHAPDDNDNDDNDNDDDDDDDDDEAKAPGPRDGVLGPPPVTPPLRPPLRPPRTPLPPLPPPLFRAACGRVWPGRASRPERSG
jgi:hypothetical protein